MFEASKRTKSAAAQIAELHQENAKLRREKYALEEALKLALVRAARR